MLKVKIKTGLMMLGSGNSMTILGLGLLQYLRSRSRDMIQKLLHLLLVGLFTMTAGTTGTQVNIVGVDNVV